MRRVVVGGGSSAGKTTFSRELAARMGVPLVELDSLFHGPDWTPTPTDIFRQRVLDATPGEAWVIDGNYSIIRDITWGRADTLVWLDPSAPRILWRLFKRTNRRILSREELWNGNRETFRNAYLSLDSLYLWVFRSHWKRRRTWPEILKRPEYRHLTVHHFRTPGEADRWLARVAATP
ncbi:MAG TPA: adenylate kinase [Candidatus Limnocylindria bacterium]|nr:adenylate kinase [Candidatus Limnocylindria bacterium]